MRPDPERRPEASLGPTPNCRHRFARHSRELPSFAQPRVAEPYFAGRVTATPYSLAHILAAVAQTAARTYEQACAAHRWHVPARYNIAADVCDKHPRDKLAMIWEDWRGNERRVELGRAPGPRGQVRERAARPRRRARRPGRDAAAPDSRDRRHVLRHLEGRRDPAVDVGALRRRGHPPPDHRLAGEGAGDRRGQRRPRRARSRRARDRAGRRAARRRLDELRDRRHGRGRSGAALLLIGHHRPGEGHPPRPSLRPGPRGVRLLPRPARGRALPRHGRVGMGGRHRAAARAVATRRDAVRVPARGRLRPRAAARRALEAPSDERVHDADGDARDDGRVRCGQAPPAGLPRRLLGGRAAEPRGDPLVPRPVRGHRARLLRADRVVSAGRELSVHGGPRGLDGEGDARMGRADPRRGRAPRRAGRARRDLPAGAVEPALPDRLLEPAGGVARRPSAATGSTPRTRPSRMRTATTGMPAAPTT